ncbi:TetR/AcrR family transcriptional regulator [Rhodococcus sp. IEGM 1374]|uniref:TetR/AcrR family transcriptional regulator n=1 Tax=Rhodococcus sp. IEGM 1374 TaxID=3082221 RepID=UPI002954C18C|nr:TetR/AcrR family transcriptional regulator [Rhodococcus sp. IEGM 1374]MDV7990501.1 TetR/AcrR family transcriptional regulator [Rhodococcus sp. IEGM 1374]
MATGSASGDEARSRSGETKRQRTRSEILRALDELSWEADGPVTVAAVCAEASISNATFYNHFDDLNQATQELISDRMEILIDQVPGPAGRVCRDYFHTIISATTKELWSRRAIFAGEVPSSWVEAFSQPLIIASGYCWDLWVNPDFPLGHSNRAKVSDSELSAAQYAVDDFTDQLQAIETRFSRIKSDIGSSEGSKGVQLEAMGRLAQTLRFQSDQFVDALRDFDDRFFRRTHQQTYIIEAQAFISKEVLRLKDGKLKDGPNLQNVLNKSVRLLQNGLSDAFEHAEKAIGNANDGTDALTQLVMSEAMSSKSRDYIPQPSPLVRIGYHISGWIWLTKQQGVGWEELAKDQYQSSLVSDVQLYGRAEPNWDLEFDR